MDRITLQILLAILKVLDGKNIEHVVFWSLFMVAFFTFARKSNLITTGMKSTPLGRCGIVIGAMGVLVKFNWTKTIQIGHKKGVVPIVAIPGCAQYRLIAICGPIWSSHCVICTCFLPAVPMFL